MNRIINLSLLYLLIVLTICNIQKKVCNVALNTEVIEITIGLLEIVRNLIERSL